MTDLDYKEPLVEREVVLALENAPKQGVVLASGERGFGANGFNELLDIGFNHDGLPV